MWNNVFYRNVTSLTSNSNLIQSILNTKYWYYMLERFNDIVSIYFFRSKVVVFFFILVSDFSQLIFFFSSEPIIIKKYHTLGIIVELKSIFSMTFKKSIVIIWNLVWNTHFISKSITNKSERNIQQGNNNNSN